jgi:hypothetical protein
MWISRAIFKSRAATTTSISYKQELVEAEVRIATAPFGYGHGWVNQDLTCAQFDHTLQWNSSFSRGRLLSCLGNVITARLKRYISELSFEDSVFVDVRASSTGPQTGSITPKKNEWGPKI